VIISVKGVDNNVKKTRRIHGLPRDVEPSRELVCKGYSKEGVDNEIL